MTKEFTRIPAFGLENDKWGASAIYKKLARDEIAKSSKPATASVEKMASRNRFFENVWKVMDMIPVIGIFSGLLGLLSLISKEERDVHSIHFVERRLIAALGFGFPFLPIVDLAVGLVRDHQAKKAEQDI